jgi:hypothetical protein
VTEAAASAVRDARRTFLRSRRRAFLASGGVALGLGALAALLLAPNRLASVRLGDVALAWWAAGAVSLGGLLALSRAFTGARGIGVPPGASRWSPLALAGVWGSPALWLGLPPLLLADGTRGLWTPAVVVGGAIVALLLLATPWRRTSGLTATASTLARTRWPAARGCHALLGSIETMVIGLFLWAQLAAVREAGAMADCHRAATVSAALLLLGALLLPDLTRVRLAALGGGLALAALAVPLVAVALGTTTAWPFVWSAVASRPRIAFGESSHWTGEGRAVRAPAGSATLKFGDEQRVRFGARGSVVVEPNEGGRLGREVEAGEEVVLHPGDRLVVPGNLALRFEAGRRIPDAPDSGPDWVEPRARPAGWLWLLALGVTSGLGTVGLPTGPAPVGGGRLSPAWTAGLAVVLVASGAALAVGWSLYAAWLTPEIYVGGVTGAEVYALPASMPGARASDHLWTWLALGGLATGGAAAALGGLGGLPAARRQVRRGRRLGLALVASAGLLTTLTPAGAWTLLVLALGLAASTLAPAAVLACWSEHATARGLTAGTGAGLAVFLLVAVGGAAGAGGLWEGLWGSADTLAPVFAAPVHALVAWLLRGQRAASQRNPLPPGLEGLAAPLPAGPRAG